MREFFEYNLTTNFTPLKKMGIRVTTFSKDLNIDIKSQLEPDCIIYDIPHKFNENRTIGMDAKAYTHIGIGHCIIATGISKEQYSRTITHLYKQYAKEQLLTPDIEHALSVLTITCDNIDQHQVTWIENIHLFTKYIPPIRVPQHFAVQDLKAEFYGFLQESNIKMSTISNHLYDKKYPSLIQNRTHAGIQEKIAQDSQITRWKDLGFLPKDDIS